MNVLVCPTAYKGTLSARVAADAMARGVEEAGGDLRVRRMPLSDGGPGLIEAILSAASEGGSAAGLDRAASARVSRWEVRGPLEGNVAGRCLWWGDGGREAVIESADACGLHLLGARRAPLEAHTLGVGELVACALEDGAEQVWVGLGGSASTDGGTGLARAFGYRFLGREGDELPLGGGALLGLDRIEPGRVPGAPCTALADVTTPLVGPGGAARTFAPQKGADADAVERLALGLERLDARIRADLDRDVARLPGSGAAGGLGAGCAAFLDARIEAGGPWVLEAVAFEQALAASDLVVTGEGAFDATSRRGKVVGLVLERAVAAGVPALLACGRIESRADEAGAAAVVSPPEGRTLDPEGLARLVRKGVGGLLG